MAIPALELDIDRLSPDIARQIVAIVRRRWAETWSHPETSIREENDKFRGEVTGLKADVAAANERIGAIERERAALQRECEVARRARAELLQSNEAPKAGVRNAESDLRAAQRIIEALERGQRLDREKVRDLQKRNEVLVCEVAELRVTGNPARPAEKGNYARSGRLMAENVDPLAHLKLSYSVLHREPGKASASAI